MVTVKTMDKGIQATGEEEVTGMMMTPHDPQTGAVEMTVLMIPVEVGIPARIMMTLSRRMNAAIRDQGQAVLQCARTMIIPPRTSRYKCLCPQRRNQERN